MWKEGMSILGPKKSNVEKFAASFSLYISGPDMSRTKRGYLICLVLL